MILQFPDLHVDTVHVPATTLAPATDTISPRQCYATPPEFWDAVNEEFYFQLDAAASPENAKCPRFITHAMDALQTDWVTPDTGVLRVWCNPPFKVMMPWVFKAHTEAQRDPSAVVCVLAPMSAAPWLTEFCYASATEIRLLYPRIQFLPPTGVKPSSNAKDNMLIVFRRKTIQAPAAIVPWFWNEPWCG